MGINPGNWGKLPLLGDDAIVYLENPENELEKLTY